MSLPRPRQQSNKGSGSVTEEKLWDGRTTTNVYGAAISDGKSLVFGIGQPWVAILASPQTICVISAGLLNLSGGQFLRVYTLTVITKRKGDAASKVPGTSMDNCLRSQGGNSPKNGGRWGVTKKMIFHLSYH